MAALAVNQDLKDKCETLEYEVFKLGIEAMRKIDDEFPMYTKEFGSYRTINYNSFPMHFLNKCIGPYKDDFFDYQQEIENYLFTHQKFSNFAIIPRQSNIGIINGLTNQRYKLGSYICYWIKEIAPDELSEMEINGGKIEKVEAENLSVFEDVFLVGFGIKGSPSEPIWSKMIKSIPHTANGYNYIYYDSDKPVGVGGVTILGDMAFMANGAVIPDARGKQIQQRLVQHRINNSISKGAKYIVTSTGLDTTSGRNMQRMGFTQAFTTENYIKIKD